MMERDEQKERDGGDEEYKNVCIIVPLLNKDNHMTLMQHYPSVNASDMAGPPE